MVEEFHKFFDLLGELCFKIKMVQRGIRPVDFTQKEGQVINSDYFDQVKKKYPKAIQGFRMAIERNNGDSVSCYLQQDGAVAVEFCNDEMKVEKIITYASIKDARENKIALIHFLTRAWDPLKN